MSTQKTTKSEASVSSLAVECNSISDIGDISTPLSSGMEPAPKEPRTVTAQKVTDASRNEPSSCSYMLNLWLQETRNSELHFGEMQEREKQMSSQGR
ncbi:hypothetical protein BJY00DRAFT_295315 [Aspergillus carlsbadensis]|nr:hypothetical protein BJY00DRAFT_295315 [Aspergillus carlsbadensis]